MLNHQLIHPKINEVLARSGHSSKVLIADGNYPAASTMGPNAELVSLNLSPGLVTVRQVLAALVTQQAVSSFRRGLRANAAKPAGGEVPKIPALSSVLGREAS